MLYVTLPVTVAGGKSQSHHVLGHHPMFLSHVLCSVALTQKQNSMDIIHDFAMKTNKNVLPKH